jgi:amino acid adenylation domain-containing protein
MSQTGIPGKSDCGWVGNEPHSIHEAIEQSSRKSPNATALICRGAQLKYSELNARANQVAEQLRKLGVGSETLVAISVERSLEMVVGLLGILKSGGAYVPLDPTYPKERLGFMLEDAKPRVLLTQKSLLDLFPETGSHILCLDTTEWTDSKQSDNAPPVTNDQSALAYLMYTSGSTGKPKGVMVEHGNVLNFFTGMDACVPLSVNGGATSASTGSPGTWLAVTSPSFDISVLELFWTLSRGFRVVIYPGEEAEQNENRKSKIENSEEYSIPSLIQRHGVTHLQCTPSMASMFLLDERTRNALGQLQALLIGGEPFQAALARDLRAVFKGTLLNMYGPTETTVWSTTWQLPSDAPPARISIGTPIANTQIYIVDSNLQPVPVGEGELLIGGAGVARGYFGREQLTAERFISNPFPAALDTRHSPRLYRTGDLARFLPDGCIEHLGRIDHQVKIRGHRVELGEIEAVLNENPAVRESVVLFKKLANGESALAAYIIPREGEKPTREQLRQFARGKLPEHMVPAHFMFMTAFPQTPNKKIDRNAFPTPEIGEMSVLSDAGSSASRSDNSSTANAGENQNDPDQPVTPVEDALAGFWKEVLGLKRVGRHDNFFECGGHSMLAMQLVAKVRKRFKIDFPLKNVFERQTLAGMAEIIEAMAWSDFAKTPRTGEREVVDV